MAINIIMTPVYKGHVSNAEAVLDSLMPRLTRLWAQPDAIVPSWATNGLVYNTYPRTANMDQDGFAQAWPETQLLMQQVNPMIKEFYQQLGLDNTKEPYVYQMWIHCHTPGADGIAHNHPDMVISGGLYLDCDKDQGNLVIEDTEYSVSSGDIMFWPGNVYHNVLPNKLNKNRIAAAIMVRA